MNSDITTIADVLEQKGHPSISKMSRQFSKPKMKLIIVKWLMEVNKLLNLKKPMSEDQIVLGASYIMEDYKNLNVADLTVFFKRLLKGKYGQFYESFSIHKLCSALDMYIDDRFEIAVERSQSKHNKFISDDPTAERTSKRRS